MRVLADLRSDCIQGVFFERSAKLMIQCKMCLKSRSEVNEDGVCHQCNRVLQHDRQTIHIRRRNLSSSIPYLDSGKILPKERWFGMRAKIDQFYNTVSGDEIEEYNKNVKRESKPAKSVNGEGSIYLLASSLGYYKIGRSINVERRVNEHSRSYPASIDLVHVIPVLNTVRCESYLFSVFASKRSQGEWFELTQDDVKWICSLDTIKLERLAKGR